MEGQLTANKSAGISPSTLNAPFAAQDAAYETRGVGGRGAWGGDHGPKQWPAAWKRLRSSASAAPSRVCSPGSPSPPCPARRGTLTRGGGSKKSGRLKPIRSTPDLTLMPPPPPQGGVPEPTHPLALFPQASSQLKRSLRRTWVDCFF